MNNISLIEKFIEFTRSEQLIAGGEKTLIAVSGGADSVVLCDLFKKAGFEFAIAHCNFQLRETDSETDAEFVKALAEKHNVAFYGERFNTIEFKNENKLSLEEAARNLRYEYFEMIRSNFGYSKIATAHHLNDSIETVIMNLIKGTGIRGITGIPVKNNHIIRPLLFALKKDIEDYAVENKIEYRNDISNLSNDFHRNKIRNEIIPVLKSINPSLESSMAKSIKHFHEAEIIFNEQIKKKLSKLVKISGNDIYYPVAALKLLPATSTYLHELLYPFGFNEDQIGQIISCFGTSGKMFYSKNRRVIIDRKNMIILPLEATNDSIIIINEENKSVDAGENKLYFEYSNFNMNMQFNNSGDVAYFDAATISFPLILRKWKAGDYLYPLGLTKKKSDKPGKKKVSDILTDLKLSVLEKERTRVLLCGEKIIWVAGIRQDERFKVTEKTTRLLKVKLSGK
ncbi:MAG: tRNA lysidine(34) synthetase TilS [Chitinophagales bacterium]